MGRRILIALAALVLGLTSTAGADVWQRVTSQEGRFSAEMPGKPAVRTQRHSTPVGAITENSWIVNLPDGTGYQVEYQDLPGIAMLFKGRKGIIKRAHKEFLKAVGGIENSTTPITIDGHQAERLFYSVPGQGQGEAVMFMVGNRLYVLNTSGADADRFFASVRIGPSVATGR